MTEYTRSEVMVANAAKELDDGDIVFVGVGLPTIACTLAKRTHAPDLRMVFESGLVDTSFSGVPLSIGDPELAGTASSAMPMYDVLTRYLQGGRIDVGFLGGAQVDRRGNLNSTVIGDYENPDVRLPGSGGACDIANNAERTVIVMPHERRRLPETVDFVTSPGYAAESNGPPPRGGPTAVITDLAVFQFDDDGRLYVDSVHPGVSKDKLREETGWAVDLGDVEATPEPSDTELDLIRSELDPDGEYTR